MDLNKLKEICNLSSVFSSAILIITMLALVSSYTYLENTYSKISLDVELIGNKIDYVVSKDKHKPVTCISSTDSISELEKKLEQITNDLALLKDSVYKLTVISKNLKNTK